MDMNKVTEALTTWCAGNYLILMNIM